MHGSSCRRFWEWTWRAWWKRLARGSPPFILEMKSTGWSGASAACRVLWRSSWLSTRICWPSRRRIYPCAKRRRCPLVFITAWEGLVDRAQVHAAQKVLIHAGAGGVGHVAVQLAHALGAQVFATVSADKKKIVEGYGATAIDYRTTKVEAYVAEHTGGEGFDIVYDTVGGTTLDDSFQAVRTYTGHVVSCLGWGVHKLAPLSFRGATYSGVFTLLPMLSGKGRAHHGDILRAATKLAEAGKLTPLLSPERFTLRDRSSGAHRRGIR